MITTAAPDFATLFPTGGRLAGLDVGTKTIGVATCDMNWSFATPDKTIIRKKFSADLATHKSVLAAHNIVGLVVVLVGLENYFETQLGKLSGGWAQRVLIAQCLLGDDSGLLLDEPTSSLDVGAARDVWQLVKSLSSSSPCVATTHDASAALEFGDRIVAIDNGIVLPPRDGNELRASFAESRMSPEAFLLELLTA